MRGRHFPRLCRSCDAPMARQQDTCWSCAAVWDDRPATHHARPGLQSGDAAHPGARDQPPTPVVIGDARAVTQARLDLDRWTDEGGRVADERSRRVRAQIAAVQ
jgi:hypothetical protein